MANFWSWYISSLFFFLYYYLSRTISYYYHHSTMDDKEFLVCRPFSLFFLSNLTHLHYWSAVYTYITSWPRILQLQSRRRRQEHHWSAWWSAIFCVAWWICIVCRHGRIDLRKIASPSRIVLKISWTQFSRDFRFSGLYWYLRVAARRLKSPFFHFRPKSFLNHIYLSDTKSAPTTP